MLQIYVKILHIFLATGSKNGHGNFKIFQSFFSRADFFHTSEASADLVEIYEFYVKMLKDVKILHIYVEILHIFLATGSKNGYGNFKIFQSFSPRADFF